jgi:phosphoribosylformimino-5-aminoimidazole carboxamide ribotide isomerase
VKVIPAIDLLDGKCVSLYQGDYDKVTVYSDDPLALIADFAAAGARRIHVVDLDAASDAPGDNRRGVQTIVSRADIEVQVAGGIRGAADIEDWLGRGVGYVVVGTLAAEQPGELQRLADQWPRRIYVALDSRGGELATHGWKASGGVTVKEMLDLFEAVPLAGFVYTDIERDGTLAGPDVEGLRRLTELSAHPVILSGGVTTIDDLRLAADGGAAGAIVGRALYEGKLDLSLAVAELAEPGLAP